MLTSKKLKELSKTFSEHSYKLIYDQRKDGTLSKLNTESYIEQMKQYSVLFDNYSREMLIFETKKQILLEKYPDMLVLFKED